MTKHGTKAFLRRHERLLVLAGTLITLMTFLVRDVLRENLRDIVASIDSAESTFLLRGATREISDQLATLSESVNAIEKQQRAARKRLSSDVLDKLRETDDQLHRHEAALRQKENSFVVSLDSFGRLIEKLPDDPDRDKQWQTFNKFWSELESSELEFNSALVNDRKTDEDPLHHALRVEGDVDLNQMKLGLLAAKTLDDAEAIKKSRERWLNVCNCAFYSVVTMGVCLALLGRLYGVDSVDPEE
jgi:hypothetical protein